LTYTACTAWASFLLGDRQARCATWEAVSQPTGAPTGAEAASSTSEPFPVRRRGIRRRDPTHRRIGSPGRHLLSRGGTAPRSRSLRRRPASSSCGKG
jgi:hypothetical protein